VTSTRARLAVLASGGGSNLQAIHDDLDDRGPEAPAELALVVSDRAGAGALVRADGWGVPKVHLPRAQSGDLAAVLAEHAITHVALAGYLQLVPTEVVRAFRGRMLNVHPALLPAFGGPGMYGAKVHAAVLAAGARVSGPTVHFVNEHYDEGAIVAQWPVPVRADDTPQSLASRVLSVEHRVYPWCIAAVTSGTVTLDESGHVLGAPMYDFDLFAPEPRHRHPFAG
jgi:formyltetrahydrofolate-dependent phosphoribosylglycinamide formyltransferase